MRTGIKKRIKWAQCLLAAAVLFALVMISSAVTTYAAGKVTGYTEAYDRNMGAFRVVVADVGNEYSNLSVAVWSEVNGQDDLFWYTPKQREDGAWYVNVLMSDHKSSIGRYFADTWATDKDGKRVYLCGAQQITEGVSKQSYEAIDISENQTTFRVEATGVICQGMNNVDVAVWSEEGWQDDLKWYAGTVSNKFFAVDIPIVNHKGSGKYYADAYLKDARGNKVFFGSANFTIARATALGVNVTEQNNDAGTFRVVVEGIAVPSGISKVEIPTWCDPNQKDIKWYVAKKDSAGNWYADINIANHAYNLGQYISHAYVTGHNGVRNYVGKTDTTIAISKKNYTAKDINGKQINFKIDGTGLAKQGMNKAQIAVWSVDKGQDDLIWYSATLSRDTISLTVDINNHRSSGKYYADAYLVDGAGGKHFLGSTNFTTKATPTPKVKVEAFDKARGTFRVVVSGGLVKENVSRVEIPIWSDPNQKDIYWYLASKDKNGDYRADVNIANHQYNLGKYYVDAYSRDANGKKTYIGGTTTDIKISKNSYTAKAMDAEQSLYKLTLTGVETQGMSSLEIAVWSVDQGQDDLVWYAGSVKNSSATMDVDLYSHRGSGKYYADAYLKDKNGKKHFLASTNFTTSLDAFTSAEKAKRLAQRNAIFNQTPSGGKTMLNFLRNALKPCGRTLYIWGGGWGGSDQQRIGYLNSWWEFFRTHATATYDRNLYKWNYGSGVDCSGYVAWAAYNTIYTKVGQHEILMTAGGADGLARYFAGQGWTNARNKPTSYASLLPGDVCSMNGHVYISLGTCPDGSAVILHSSPMGKKYGGGVQLSGTRDRNGNTGSQATRLAIKYMALYFPEWPYGAVCAGASYLDTLHTVSNWRTDPDGLRNMNAEQVLKTLFGE